ncbi:pyruvate dehydrogenase (acetyl-transferring) E1 component subunit alpha [Salinibacter sp.]|uniref:pyruvate dehydrogenase (acetyl-transferring) E1 component subunit alpha n=1 Tax=Salinibacter sp. TaxID=2065818 RepID=UPI0021E93E77|nr:pyruvate dehydrogenase (acetyl-transferring) E1 component subunit alpha [Salinibacter sp.]
MADDTSAPNSSSGSNGSLNGGADFPEGFPHASRLKQAGVTSLADLRDVESLEDLSGIGPAYAQDIQNALEGAGTGAPATGSANGTSTGAATTEKRPSPLSEEESESPAGGAATRQTIDIPEGPLEETVTYETYPADTYGHDELGIADDEVLDLLRNMLLQRRFENRCRQMYQRQKISGFLHLYIGQEAVSTGSVNAIELGDDSVITAYRDHGMGLAMGITPEEGMAELFGKETGCSKGKGGSMHFFDAEKKMMGGHAIVGAHLPLGAGLAFAHKYRGEDNVCLCFFGDGAMHQGAFREACNLAGIYELPIVFVCENNQYAMGTAVDRAFSKPDLFKHGYNFDFPASLASGMDVFSVNKAVKDHVENYARNDQPSLLEVRTYRYQGHSITDPAEYRGEGELDQRQSQDAINRLQDYILDRGLATEADMEAIDEEVKERVKDAIDAASEASFPDEEAIYDDIYTQEDYPFIA